MYISLINIIFQNINMIDIKNASLARFDVKIGIQLNIVFVNSI